MYYYNTYGLNIESDIELIELIKCENLKKNEIDVSIFLGEEKKEINRTKAIYKSRREMYIEKAHVAKYSIYDGSKIIIEKYKNAEIKKVKSFLLGWAFGAIFAQRGVIPIHGSSILLDNKAVVIAGKSRAGKSTLANRLMNKGYKFISDDISVLDLDGKSTPIVKPAYPVSKIRPDIAEILGLEVNDENRRTIVDNSNVFNKTEEIIGILVYLVEENVDEVKVEEIKGKYKIETLIDNIYSIKIETTFGIEVPYFTKCLKIANELKAFKITRPKGKFTVDKQVELIENICLS